jgi:hypothetical protein
MQVLSLVRCATLIWTIRHETHDLLAPSLGGTKETLYFVFCHARITHICYLLDPLQIIKQPRLRLA